MPFDYDPTIPHGGHNFATGIDYDYLRVVARQNQRASMPNRPNTYDGPSIPRRASTHGKNDGRVPVIISLYIARRWYTQQNVLKIKNHNFDITFRIKCAKGTFTLEPGEIWEHAFIRGAVAQRTMDELVIFGVRHRGRALFGDEIKIVMRRHDSSCGQVTQITVRYPERRKSTDGPVDTNTGKHLAK